MSAPGPMLQARGIKLAPRTLKGQRRTMILDDVSRNGPVKMAQYRAQDQDCVRWLWRSGALEVIDQDGLIYIATIAGKKALERALKVIQEIEGGE